MGYGVKIEQMQKIITNKMNRLPANLLYIAGAPNKREGGAGGWKKQSW